MHHPLSHLALFVILTRGLLANDTSLHDGRFGPEPLEGGAESPVRMVAEHLEISFGYRDTEVHCTFTFRNTRQSGVVEELVGFPDVGAALQEMKRRDPDKADVIGERVNTRPLRDLVTSVNGQRVATELKLGDGSKDAGKRDTTVWSWDRKTRLRAWHTMRVAFPAGEDVRVERRYAVRNGASALGVCFFNYTTATGAPWHGTIGRLQADVTLRDGITADQLVWPGTAKLTIDLQPTLGTWPARKEWQVLDPTHLRLVWRDFEPRTDPERRGFALSREFHGW